MTSFDFEGLAGPGRAPTAATYGPGDLFPGLDLYGQGFVCRACGCDDDHACEGGCDWSEPNLCTACVEASFWLRNRRLIRALVWLFCAYVAGLWTAVGWFALCLWWLRHHG